MPNNWQSLFQSVINEYPAMKRKRKAKEEAGQIKERKEEKKINK